MEQRRCRYWLHGNFLTLPGPVQVGLGTARLVVINPKRMVPRLQVDGTRHGEFQLGLVGVGTVDDEGIVQPEEVAAVAGHGKLVGTILRYLEVPLLINHALFHGYAVNIGIRLVSGKGSRAAGKIGHPRKLTFMNGPVHARGSCLLYTSPSPRD